MARYGIDYYGLGYYGSDNPVTFDASPFTATPSKQGQILLNWQDPKGSWSRLVIIRNPYGFPIDPWDGVQVLTAYNGSDPVTYLDNNGLKEGQFYYYSIFVYSLAQYTWVTAGKAMALSVKDCGNTRRLYDYLPGIYKITNPYTPTTDWDNDALYQFLSNFGFELDYEQTLTDLMRDRYNIEKVSGKLIPTMMNQFGQTYEPAIGLQQNRKLLRDSMALTQQKGSKAGLTAFIKDFTGWAIPAPIAGTPNPSVTGMTVGVNLMLDYNDSSFEESIGHWNSADGTAEPHALRTLTVTSFSLTTNVATLVIGTHTYNVGNQVIVSGLPYPLFNSASAVTITAVTSTSISYALTGSNIPSTSGYNPTTGSYGTVTPSPVPWAESTAPALFPNKTTGILALRNLGTSAQTISAFCGDSSPIYKGIPVTAGTTYTFSAYASKGSYTARNVTAKIQWYDRFGALLSTSSGTAVSDNVANFASTSRPYVTAAAPTNAYYACPGVSIASVANAASNEHHYIDACQFEASSTVGNFEEARLIKVVLRANRINELINPNFTNSGTPWAVTGATSAMLTNTYEPTTEVFSITTASIVSNVATVTLNKPHSYKVGSVVVISGVTGTGASNYNGSRTITAVTLNTFTYAVTASNSTVTTGTVYKAGTSLQLTATGTSVALNSWDGATTSQQMGIYYPNTSYTFSVYALAQTASETLTASINWYTASHSLISTSSGAATAVGTHSPTRIYVTDTAPATAAYATVSVTGTTVVGHQILFDLALFENTGSLLDYFDGSNGPAGTYDLMWEGNILNGARSHYYKNRLATQTRLIGATIAAELPMGSSLATYIAQPLT